MTHDGIALTIISFPPDAKSVLADANPDYEPPLPEEQRRIFIARLRVQNVGEDAHSSIGLGGVIDRLYLIESSQAPLGYMAEPVGHMGCSGIIPDRLHKHNVAALFPGGMAEGNLCFEVEGPKSETDLDLALMYDAQDGYDNQRFLALANPDSVEPARVVDARFEPQYGQMAAGRSRSNPVAPGRYVETADGLTAVTIVSADMDADLSALLAESPDYEPDDPHNRIAEGNRLVAARVRVQNIGGDFNSALTVYDGGFSLVGSSAISFHARGCRATFIDPALFLGGIVEVNVCFEIPESETDLVLSYLPTRWLLYASPSSYGSTDLSAELRWLAFANPDVVEAPRIVESSPEPSSGQAAGRSRSDPVPPGESAHNHRGMAVSIVSANLDAAENPSGNPPADGMRFVTARTRIEWVGGNASDTTPVSSYEFSLAGSSAVVFTAFDNPCGAVPDEWPSIQLSGGEAVEIDVCFKVPESETDLILIYGYWGEESDPRWLRMPES